MTSEPRAAGLAAAAPVEAPFAVAAAYQRRAGQLWSFARRLRLDAEAAEDVMQKLFARAVALAPGSVNELDAWLFRVVHNLAVDSHRRAARAGAVREVAPPILGGISDDRLVLWQAVDRLPPRQRAVIYLRFRADLEFASIAAILGITDGGARANCSRALDRLREWMDGR